ncbi:MAG: SDR family oxidoreductase [Gammaproteobacteria bacterium]|nr:SDR family oxidoreductase [Gammaproteobacteria bacterium]MXY58101.1 SDR family oxidoreductase [Gammaproteobacteria bacterium]MYF30573.1 SDR family oxidoreductase [Gammaproteobacteria bacterium]MYK48471.1 SDR family oxidoreductase [Gammaproteobacteria bacterium]
MDLDLVGRTALVTGGSLGLGRAMAAAFHGAGANVALVARRENVLAEAKAAIEARSGGRVAAYPCDVTDAEAIKHTVEATVADLGPIDILVNNAGQSQTGRFEDITDEVWQGDLDLKLFAAIRFSRLAFPGMKERRWGRIINILNTAAKAPPPGSAPTSVSRAAGLALTKVLAGEGAPHNVLVNALMIGSIKSDQVRRAYDRSDKSVDFETFMANSGRSLPMGRMGEAEECGNVALFLASNSASYLTGCAINMDGGLSRVV